MSDRLCKFYSAPPIAASAAGSRSIGDTTDRAIKSLAVAASPPAAIPRLPIVALRDCAVSIASIRAEASGSPSDLADHWRRPDLRLPEHTEAARETLRGSRRPRSFSRSAAATETSQRPARAAKNPLHPGVRYGDDIGELPHQAELDHAGEEFVGRSCDAARRLRLSGAEIDAEAAAFPDRVGMPARPVRPRAPGTCREAWWGRSSARAARSPEHDRHRSSAADRRARHASNSSTSMSPLT